MPNNSKDYLELMFSFAAQAGKVALKHIHKSAPTLKNDSSVITKADQEISKLCHQALAKVLKDPAHLLLDEEDPKIMDYLNQDRLEQTDFLWAVDPIDGTRPYANHMPLFGISLGVLKDLKPWLGLVYFPALGELFYCDGRQSYFVENAFQKNQRRIKIKPMQEKISPKSLFFCNDTFFKQYAWNDANFHILVNPCAVVNLCWPAIGRGIGCFLRSHLWDIAGSWPIIRHAGLDFRSMKTGKLMERVDVELFGRFPKPWEFKEYYLISSQEHYFQIKSKMELRQKQIS